MRSGSRPAKPNDCRRAPTMCSVDAKPAAALKASPEFFIDHGGEAEVIYDGFQVMDTSSTENKEDSDRERRAGQLGLTAGKKRVTQPTRENGHVSNGDASASDGSGPATANEAGRDIIGADSDCDPVNSCAGWTVVGPRRRGKKLLETDTSSQRGTPAAGKPGKTASATIAKSIEERRRELKAQYVARVNANMARAARMPTFARKDEHRVVIRPRGGLAVNNVRVSVLRDAITAAARITRKEALDDSFAPNAAQNIVVLSTPSEERSFRYGSIKNITIGEQTFEAFAYKSTPENTSRGVISGVGPEETEEDITRCLVNRQNPTIMAAHRLGRTESVVILFDGEKVPYYVKYGGVVTKCTLYRQHREVCSTCGQIGHRRDVCPTPNVKVCFACGRKNPDEEHVNHCKPRCKLCGGSHVTGAGSCKNKFKMPPQIKKRIAAKLKNGTIEGKMAPASRPAARPSRKDDFLAQKVREAHTSQAKARSKSKSRPDGLTWADVTSGKEHRKRSKSSRRSASGRRSVSKNRMEPVSKSDVTARPAPAKPEPQSVAKATSRERGRNEERGGGESNRTKQCKAETREMKAMIKSAQKEIQNLQTVVTALQLTIKQQREHIAKQDAIIRYFQNGGVRKDRRIQETEEKMATESTVEETGAEPQATSSSCQRTTQTARNRPQSRKAAFAAARGIELQSEDEDGSESEVEEGEYDDDALSTATGPEGKEKTQKPVGYAGLSNRLKRLENTYKIWDRNLKAMEQRIVQRCSQLMQQQIAQQMEQLEKQMMQQFANMLQQHQCNHKPQDGQQ